MKKIVGFILKHKVYSLIIAVVLVVGGNYAYKALKGNTIAASYVLGAVSKGALITSIFGSGQISVTNQVDIKAKAGGEVTGQ